MGLMFELSGGVVVCLDEWLGVVSVDKKCVIVWWYLMNELVVCMVEYGCWV